MVTSVLKYAERKCIGKTGWSQILTSEKFTVPLKEWMAARILEIIIVPLKERITGTNVSRNKHSTTGRTTQTINDCKFSCQNKYSVLQRMDYPFGQIK